MQTPHLLLALAPLLQTSPDDGGPRPGAAGLGDRYYPTLGNGGYDARHYDVELSVDVEAGGIEAKSRMTAVATHALSRFNLDLVGLEVGSVSVDGMPAKFERADGELVITPASALAEGAEFTVEIAYRGTPAPVKDPGVPFVPGVGWTKKTSTTTVKNADGKTVRNEDGKKQKRKWHWIFAVSEPSGTRSWVPVNDHPLDKATWSFTITVPAPYVVAANGILVEEVDDGERRTFRFRASDPMASYLATICIGEFDVETSAGPGGLPLRHYFPAGYSEKRREPFARTGEMIEFYADKFGPYPFECFGGIVLGTQFGGALETQTIPVYSRGAGEQTIAHELAHQWFGDSVSPAGWDHLWLNEGFATYAEWLWQEHLGGAEAYDKRVRRGYKMMRRMKTGPPGETGEVIFGMSVYVRGAWTLHALRNEIGDEAFFGTLRAWTSRYHDGAATTADFVALAEEVSGKELDALFESWVFGKEVPVVEEYLDEPSDTASSSDADPEERP